MIGVIGEGEDITCTVINTYDRGGTRVTRGTTPVTVAELETPCYDGTAENELGECVAPEPQDVEVLGIQIEATTTTVDAVTTDTLPFTGDAVNGLVMTALLVLFGGALVLGGSFFESALIRGGRHESSQRLARGWRNH